MRTLPARYDPERVEAETRAFWSARGLPRSGRPLGPPTGARVHQFLGALLPAEGTLAALHRAVIADAEARYLAQAGRRPSGLLLVRFGRGDRAELADLLDRAGVWVGAGPPRTVAEIATPEQVALLLHRLALGGLLRSKEAPMRACPGCRTPRTPETIVYVEEDGPAYVVRFPLVGDEPRTNVLVWTDAAWKLLGASAILIHPDLPYVRLRFRRRGQEEEILVLRSAMGRLTQWFEGCEMEVLEEKPGSAWVGRSYVHPFATEFPLLARLPSPAGTVVAATEVTDTQTGAVPLVPAHGGSDHSVSQNAALAGWPVVAMNGQLTQDVPGKYAGLPLDSAEAFATRDLNDSGLLFAQLTVRRGVPHCSICGSLIIWFPGRAWCAEIARLPTERLEMLRRLLPSDPLPPVHDAVPWPITEWTPTDDPLTPELSECGSCGRLTPPGPPAPCECGQATRPIRRRLLPAFHEAMAQWAADTPFPPGEAVRLYLPDRRRGPSAIHHMFGIEASAASVGDIRAHRVPTLPVPDLPTKGSGNSFDGLRAALLRLTESPRGGEVGLADRRRQEERRLRKVWEIAQDVTARLTRARYAPDQGSIATHLGELEEEDRAFLSLFERMRLDVLREYDLGNIGGAHDRLVHFLEDDLRDGYLPVVRPRLDAEALPPTKTAAFRLLAHVVPLWAELYAPIAPHTMEAIHRAFRGDSDSLFGRRFVPIQEMVLDAKLEDAYRQWQSFTVALKQYRGELGLPATTPLPSVVVFVRDEEVAQALRASRAVLQRLALVDKIDVASPNQPWDGKKVEARPNTREIQRAYPSQAARIVRILEGMSGRRLQDALRSRTLEIALEGQPVPILPSMVDFTEVLPPGVVPVPWSLGELFVQVPAAVVAGSEGHAPALTPDGFRLLNAIRRHLRRGPQASAVDRIVIAAHGPLAEEIERHAPALSRYFDGRELEIRPTDEGFPASEVVFGRTRRGDRWSAWLPGVTIPLRPPAAVPRPHRPRVRPVAAFVATPEHLEFLDDELRARESTVRETVESFDRALGRPIVGPAKLSAAWDAGFRSFESFSHASYEELAPVPGFGPYVAAAIVGHFGGTVPARPPRDILHDRFVRPAPEPEPPDSESVPEPSGTDRDANVEPDSQLPEPIEPDREELGAPPTFSDDAPDRVDPGPSDNTLAPPLPSEELPPETPPSPFLPVGAELADAGSRSADDDGAAQHDDAVDAIGPSEQLGSTEPDAEPMLPAGDTDPTDGSVWSPTPEALDSPAVPDSVAGPQAPLEDALPVPEISDSPAPEEPPEPADVGPPTEEGDLAPTVPDDAAPAAPDDPTQDPIPIATASGDLIREVDPADDAVGTGEASDFPPEERSPLPSAESGPGIDDDAASPSVAPELGSDAPGSSDSQPTQLGLQTAPRDPPSETTLEPPLAPGAAVPEIGESSAGESAPEEPPPGGLAPITQEMEGAPAPIARVAVLSTEEPALPDVPPAPAEEAPSTETELPVDIHVPPPAAAEEAPSDTTEFPVDLPLPPPAPPEEPASAEAGLSEDLPFPPLAPTEESPSTEAELPVDLPLPSPSAESAMGSPPEPPVDDEPTEERPPAGAEPPTVQPAEPTAPSPTDPTPDSDLERTVAPSVSTAAGDAELGPANDPPEPIAPTTADVTAPSALGDAAARLEPMSDPTGEEPVPDALLPAGDPPPPVDRPDPELGTSPPPPPAAEPSPEPLPDPLAPTGVPVAPFSTAVAAPTGPAPGVVLWPGGTATPAWHAFLEATASGHRGVCLSREFPDRLRAYLGHRDVEVHWLSNVGRESSVRPGDLPAIAALFRRSLTERGATAVYLEGIEYLLRVHGLAKILEFLSDLDGVARTRDARVWIPVNPALVDPASHDELLSALRVRST